MNDNIIPENQSIEEIIFFFPSMKKIIKLFENILVSNGCSIRKRGRNGGKSRSSFDPARKLSCKGFSIRNKITRVRRVEFACDAQ